MSAGAQTPDLRRDCSGSIRNALRFTLCGVCRASDAGRHGRLTDHSVRSGRGPRLGKIGVLPCLAYRETKYDYVRQVDLHSHWIGLAMLMIVLGVVFDEVAFGERARSAIALAMLAGSVVFPLGVILQTARMARLGSALAIAGSALVIVALGATAVGFMRESRKLICIPELFTITARARSRKRRPCSRSLAMTPSCWLAVRA